MNSAFSVIKMPLSAFMISALFGVLIALNVQNLLIGLAIAAVIAVILLRMPFEAVIAVMMFAGHFSYKQLVNPPSPTTLESMSLSSIMLIVLVIIVILQSNRFDFRKIPGIPAVMLFGLAVYLTLGIIWSPSSIYAPEKAMEISLYVFFAVCMLFSRIDLNRDRILMLIIGIAFSLAAIALLKGGSGGDAGRFSALGGGPNVFARITSYGTLLAVGFLLCKPQAYRGLLIPLYFVVPFLIAATILSGSRGGIIALFASLIILFVFLLWEKRKQALKLAFLFALCVFALNVLFSGSLGDVANSVTVSRFELLTSGDDMGGSVNARLGWMDDIQQTFFRGDLYTVFGYGTGAFAPMFTGADIRDYPHNIFAEVALENGLTGLLLLSGFIIYVLVANFRALRREADLMRMVLVVCFVYSVIAAQFSGDIFDNRFLVWFGCLSLLPKESSGHSKMETGD